MISSFSFLTYFDNVVLYNEIMHKIRKHLSKIRIRNIVGLTFAGIINAFGVTIFLTPVFLIDSGISGTSYLCSLLTNGFVPLSIFLIVLNFPFFFLGFKKLGFTFVIYSLYAITIYSLASYLFQLIPSENGSIIAKNDILLCAIFGGMLSGVGSGLTIRFGGTLDGVEVIAVLFSKKLNLSVGTIVMIYNVIIYIVAGILFKCVLEVENPFLLPLYSIITYMIGIKSVDFVVEGLDKAKAIYIFTDETEEVCEALSNEFDRGVTLLEAEGYYSKTKQKIIYFVCNRFEIPRVKNIIHEIDNNSFFSICEVSEAKDIKLDIRNIRKKK